jgi:hypothetical protein
MAPDANYHSYLLRLWRDSADQPWRASLQCTATEERVAFTDLRALFSFLLDQLALDGKEYEQATIAPLPETQDSPPST